MGRNMIETVMGAVVLLVAITFVAFAFRRAASPPRAAIR